jgi:thiamine biosynthesis lipoprotein
VRFNPVQSHSTEWLFCLLPMICLLGCDGRPAAVQLVGDTMGTTWHVTYIDVPGVPGEDRIQQGIEERLSEVDRSMSTYRADSEINQFNSGAVGVPFNASGDFYQVLATAMNIGQQSEGAYDVTVAPLVDLWGFGPEGAVAKPPSAAAIEERLVQVGQDKLDLDDNGITVHKLSPLTVDFSSLAKGFAVDRLAQWLLEQGIARFLVEVGGEMRLSGLSGRGDPWHVAIEQPDSVGRAVAVAMSVTDNAVATSGDYRNYFEVAGQRYSHSIDPRTGYPVAHDLVSVTVVHSSAAQADAWATALTVLGAERAMAVAQAQALAVYFIRGTDDGFVHSHTPAFEPFLSDSKP